jgi:hypothetical protein
LPLKPDEEFNYKGKYQEAIGSQDISQHIFSHNYFESVFHPLFYKFFQCKRLQCKGSIYCPMKHSEEERVAWEEEFSFNWKKDRSIYYPKKSQNFFEFSDVGSDESQYGKPLRWNNYGSQNKASKAYYNNKPQYNHRGQFNEKRQDYVSQKQYNPGPYEQFQQPQFFSGPQQVYATPSNSNYYNNSQFDCYSQNESAFWNGNRNFQNNGFTTFPAYLGVNQFPEYVNAPVNYKRMPTENSQKSTEGSNSPNQTLNSQNFFGSPIRSDYQVQDDESTNDFDSIFSSIKQFNGDFDSALTNTSTNSSETSLSRKGLSSENAKFIRSSHIEVK